MNATRRAGRYTQYAEYILQAITGLAPHRPASVADIVEDVDWSQRMGIDLDELNEGLRMLIDQRLIAELPGYCYSPTPLGDGDGAFTPVPAHLYQTVVDERSAQFDAFMFPPDATSARPEEPA